jgi:hypothetical protein
MGSLSGRLKERRPAFNPVWEQRIFFSRGMLSNPLPGLPTPNLPDFDSPAGDDTHGAFRLAVHSV